MFKPSRLVYRGTIDSKESTFDALQSGKLDADEAVDKFHDLKDRQTVDREGEITDIAAELEKQVGTSLNDKDRFIDATTAQRYLERLKQKGNPQELKKIREEVNERRKNVRNFISALDEGDNVSIQGTKTSVFTLDEESHTDERKEILAEFLKLSPELQLERLHEIKKDIESRTKQFHELIGLLDPATVPEELENFRTLDKEERVTYLKEVKDITEEYKKLLDKSKASSRTIQKKFEHFQSLGIDGKKLELNNLKESLQVPEKDKEFNEAKKHRREKYPDFTVASTTEKEGILRKIRTEIKDEYMDRLKKHPNYKVLTGADITSMEDTFKGNDGRFKIETGEMCLTHLDNCMKQAGEIDDESKKYDPKILNHFMWDKITFTEKKKLLEFKGKIQTYSENQDNMKYDKAYLEKLEKYRDMKPMGIITEKGVKNYYKWFQNLDLQKKKEVIEEGEKRTTLDDLEETKKARIETVKRFSKLPKQIQKEYYDEFAEAGFEERMELLQTIETEDTESVAEFTEKLEGMVSENLLTKKSQKRYLKWFTKDLNIEERNIYLENCNLDKPERKAYLQVFEDYFIEDIDVSDSEKESMKKQFYKSDFKQREVLLRKWFAEHLPEGDIAYEKILNGTMANVKSDKKAEKSKETDIRYTTFLESAEKREDQGDRDAALVLYEEIVEGEFTTDPQEMKRIKKKVQELKEEQEHYEQLQEGHFQDILEGHIDDIIGEDHYLQEQQMDLTILDKLYEMQHRNEILFDKHLTPEEQMHKSLDDSYTREFNEEFTQYTNDSASLMVDSKDELQVGETREFDLHNWKDGHNRDIWESYLAHKEEEPLEDRYDPSLKLMDSSIQQTYDSKRFNRDIVYPRKMEFIGSIMPQLMTKLKVDIDELSPGMIKAIETYMYERDYSVKLQKTRLQHIEE